MSVTLTAFTFAAAGAIAQPRDDDGDGFALARVGALLSSNGIAFDEISGKAYVASHYGGLTVVDVATGRNLSTLDISREVVAPNGVAYAAGTLYVGSLHDIAIVDAASGRVSGRIDRPFFAGSVESEIVASPDGTRVYAAGGTSTVLAVIDVATESAETLIPVGANCNRIALSPDGAIAYLTNKEQGLLLAVDLEARVVLDKVEIAPAARPLDFPCGVGVSPTSGNIYVAWVATDYLAHVSEFDSNLRPLRTFETGRFTTGLDVSPDGRFALLGSGQLLDLATGFFAADLPLPQNGLSEVAFRADSNEAIVTCDSERAIRVVSGFEPSLSATGSPRIGARLDFTFHLPAAAGKAFQLVASNSTDSGFLAGEGIQFPLDLDPLFQLSRSDGGAFRAWSGHLDANGRGRASLTLSRDLPIRGAGYPISLALATFAGPGGRFDVSYVSNLVTAWIRP